MYDLLVVLLHIKGITRESQVKGTGEQMQFVPAFHIISSWWKTRTVEYMTGSEQPIVAWTNQVRLRHCKTVCIV